MASALLIDGHSLTFRAYYSVPDTLTWQEQPINAVYGFASFLLGAIERIQPTHVLVCFDRKEPTFRHHLFDEYKGTRSDPPERLIPQFELLTNFLAELGVETLSMAGWEADDLLGSMSRMFSQQQIPCTILTGDRDAYQLVGPLVSVMITKRGVSDLDVITPDVIQHRYGLTPIQLIDLKALQGDTSDNIPGVPGIGEKTALSLMMKHGSLNAIYHQLAHITPLHVQKKLESGKEKAYLSQQLATIQCDVPIEGDVTKYISKLTPQQWGDLFLKYEFTSLAKRVGVTPVALTKPLGDYQWIDSIDALSPHLSALKHGFAFDVETTGLNPIDATLVAVSIAYRPHHALVIPIHSGFSQLSLFSQSTPNESGMLALLAPYFSDPTIPKYTHNGKFDMAIMAQHGVPVSGIQFDSMLAGFLLNPTESVGLKEMAKRELGMGMTLFEDLSGPIASLPPDVLCQYAGADADATIQLKDHLSEPLKASTAKSLFYETELPLQQVLVEMELAGVGLDLTVLDSLKKAYSQRLETLKTSIYELAGHEFNINSTKQLGVVLYQELGIPSLKSTKTGHSTNSEVLTQLAGEYPICDVLLTYRKLEKLMNTYIVALPELVSPVTNRLHTHFNPVGAITGRLSSTKPNLQNIPIKDPEGMAIRGAFVSAFSNGFILSADYSQIELRLMAHLSEDPALIGAFHEGMDVHRLTASRLFNVALDEVTSAQRYQAKAVNFGIIYGISAFGLANNTGLSRADAQQMIDAYFSEFPGVKSFMTQTIEMAKKNGCVWTEFGRIRPLPDIHSKNVSLRQFAERTAINSRVQGTAADLIKMAMVRIHRLFKEGGYQSRLTIQVHDELVIDCVESEVEKISQLVKQEMEGVGEWRVPLVVDLAVGKNWKDVS